MSRLVFGVHGLCPTCDGTGKRSAMTDADRAQRKRELRIAKRTKTAPPALVKSDCAKCRGTGVVQREPGT